MLLLVSHSVMSNSLQLHRLQRAKLPCPSLSPRVCSNSCPLSHWCYLAISSSTTSFSSPQSLPTSGSFSMSWLFTPGGYSIEASASTQCQDQVSVHEPPHAAAQGETRSRGCSTPSSDTLVARSRYTGPFSSHALSPATLCCPLGTLLSLETRQSTWPTSVLHSWPVV